MGRPIKEKFFGNTITPYNNRARGGNTGVGAEGIASVVVVNTATNSGYSTTTNTTWVASAPQIAGGIPASGTALVQYHGGTGRIQSLTVTTPGTGYNTTASLTITYTPSSAGSAATFVATTTTNRQDAIQIVSYIGTGSSAISNGDIIKQESSQRYLVRNAQGVGVCKLSTGTLTAGNMHIIASDWTGATYWVTKLTARKARLVNRTSTSTAIYSMNKMAPWTVGTTTGTVVTLSNTN
jgi:hypothetical protein